MLKPIFLAVAAALFMPLPLHAVDKASEARLDEVARRGIQVMPFDLEQTTHVFKKTEKGGLQQVIVKDNFNTAQIKRIQAHLSEISRQFMQGDFRNPAKIHGEDMPGLAEFDKTNPDQIKIKYGELPNGAQIDYSTDTPNLIDAIHQWFDAQLRDHARHTLPGQNQHQMHSQ